MLEGILSISGQPGLFKLISQTKNGIIVEAIDTKKRVPVYSNSKVSALEDIAVFTTGEEIPLKEVFKKIYTVENKGQTSVPRNAETNQIKEYFEDILPDYDKERVYVSDMKKIISWYNILVQENIISEQSINSGTEDAQEAAPISEVSEVAVEEVKPKVKAKKTPSDAKEESTTTKTKKATTKKQ